MPRSKSHTSQMAALFGIVVIVCMIGGAVLSVLTLRDREIDNWRHQMDSLSLVLAEDISQSVFAAYLVLDAITDELEKAQATDQSTFRARLSREEMHYALREKIRGVPQIGPFQHAMEKGKSGQPTDQPRQSETAVMLGPNDEHHAQQQKSQSVEEENNVHERCDNLGKKTGRSLDAGYQSIVLF